MGVQRTCGDAKEIKLTIHVLTVSFTALFAGCGQRVPRGTRPKPFNSTPMAVNSTWSGSPHVRPMGRTCGEPGEIKKNTHPKNITALHRDQGNVVVRNVTCVGGHGISIGGVRPQAPTHPPTHPLRKASPVHGMVARPPRGLCCTTAAARRLLRGRCFMIAAARSLRLVIAASWLLRMTAALRPLLRGCSTVNGRCSVIAS